MRLQSTGIHEHIQYISYVDELWPTISMYFSHFNCKFSHMTTIREGFRETRFYSIRLKATGREPSVTSCQGVQKAQQSPITYQTEKPTEELSPSPLDRTVAPPKHSFFHSFSDDNFNGDVT